MRFAVRAWAALLALAALAPRAAASESAPAPASAEAAGATPAPPTATLPAIAPAPAAAPESRWDWALLPLVFYAPETSLGVAFGIGVYDDTPAPPDRPRRDDSASLLFQGTLKKQFSIAFSGVKFWHAGG